MEDFYAPHYREIHTQVKQACDCIESNKSSLLGSEIEAIKFSLDRVQVQTWDDAVGIAFLRNKQACANQLQSIVDSISTVFIEAENIYQLLNEQLTNLQNANTNYQTIYKNRPIKDSFLVEDTVTNNGEEETIETYPGYVEAYDRWKSALSESITECNNCIKNVESYLKALAEINSMSITSQAAKNHSSIVVPKLYSPKYCSFSMEFLTTDSQKSELLEMYASEESPLYTRYKQRTFEYVQFGPRGKNIYTSGCGVCSFACAISSALTNEYGENIKINPEQLLNSLYDKLGGNSSTYYRDGLKYENYTPSQVSVDLTNVYRDISILEIDRNESGILNQEALEAVTDAGGTVCLSLKGRSHFVAVTANDGNGNFWVADSGKYDHDGEAIPMKTSLGGGSIAGKKVWLIFPNDKISVDGDQVTVEGVDASVLPKINSFETAGKAYSVDVDSSGNFIVDGLSDGYSQEANSTVTHDV